MKYDILGIAMFLIFTWSCSAQRSISGSSKYSAPFSESLLKDHLEAINTGASYLLLTVWSEDNPNARRLICTSWFERGASEPLDLNAVDRLLNRGILPQQDMSMIQRPISLESIGSLDEFSICEIARVLFSEEGYYIPQPYFVPQDLLLAVLIERGVQVHISDYDGYPDIANEELDCP